MPEWSEEREEGQGVGEVGRWAGEGECGDDGERKGGRRRRNNEQAGRL